uniref:Morphine related protein-1 n=1 Tax=Rattus norvegicus TaxID=10116 RepID=Q9WUN6_RAT|nr:morphine related protein-1 [Rattus norvegicus]
MNVRAILMHLLLSELILSPQFHYEIFKDIAIFYYLLPFMLWPHNDKCNCQHVWIRLLLCPLFSHKEERTAESPVTEGVRRSLFQLLLGH